MVFPAFLREDIAKSIFGTLEEEWLFLNTLLPRDGPLTIIKSFLWLGRVYLLVKYC